MIRSLAAALALILFSTVGGSFYPVYGSSSALSSDRTVSLNDKEEQAKNPESSLPSAIPELRLDLPKLDQPKQETEPKKHAPLKGSVQHQEHLKDKPFGHQAGQFDGGLQQNALEGRTNKGQIKGKIGGSHLRESNELGLGIIGVKFVMAFGRAPVIYQVFPGTPAAEAGMHVRDVIIAVDGIPTMGLSKDEVYNMIVGQPNTNVTISFKRKGDFLVKTMTRMDLNKVIDPSLRHDYLRM